MALLVGVCVFLLSCLVDPVTRETWWLGNDYAAMSKAPFACLGPFPHRVLGPLLAHVLGLGGDDYWIFHHAVLVLLLASLTGIAVSRGLSWARASLLTLALSLTLGFALFKTFVGYSEPLSFLLMVLALAFVRRSVLFWSLQLLALLNHEHMVFFWPWLLLQRRLAGTSWRADAIGAPAVAAAYVLFRLVVDLGATAQLYTLENQLDWATPSLRMIGMCVLTTIYLLMTYGLMPVLLAWNAASAQRRSAVADIALFLLSLFALCSIALDTFRFVGYALIPTWLAGIRFVQRRHGPLILAALAAATVGAIRLQQRTFAPLVQTIMANQPDPATEIVRKVIPEQPWLFAGVGVAAAAIVALGIVWGRRDRRLGLAPP
ncbi:MAG TPA: hypothetical protein VF384_11890 [Planctomycetota bacterium]